MLRGGGRQLFERQRRLIDQARRALRPLSVNLALQFGDPQLLLRDQRHVFGCFGARDRQLRGDHIGMTALLQTLSL